jgi:hypothetical protein
MAALGKTPGSGTGAIKTVASRLGLDTSHFAHGRNFKPLPAADLPFVNVVRRGGQSGLSIAARWFLDRGYVVSVPLEPAAHDLVTESDSGLKRVQVKSTQARRTAGDTWRTSRGVSTMLPRRAMRTATAGASRTNLA